MEALWKSPAHRNIHHQATSRIAHSRQFFEALLVVRASQVGTRESKNWLLMRAVAERQSSGRPPRDEPQSPRLALARGK